MTNQERPLSAEEIWRIYDAMEVRLTAPVSERMHGLAPLSLARIIHELIAERSIHE